MIPLSQTLLLASYPKEKAGTALAMWSITTLVAPVVGPLLGGWITDNISWPWIFYINVPVGLAAAAVTWMIYRTRETATAQAADRRRRPGAAGPVGRRAAGDARQGQGPRLVPLGHDRGARGRRRARPRALHRVGAHRGAPDRGSARSSRAATSRWARSRSRSATACSSATSCCCRCGCSSTWATPRRSPAWRSRPWACSRSCLAPWSARTSRRVDPRILATIAFVIFALVHAHALALQHAGRPRAR